jgi:hypothetical protein
VTSWISRTLASAERALLPAADYLFLRPPAPGVIAAALGVLEVCLRLSDERRPCMLRTLRCPLRDNGQR